MIFFRNLASLTLFLILISTTSFAGTSPLDEKLDSWVKSEIKHYSIPGLSIAVINNGKIETVYTYGYSNIDKKLLVTPNVVN